MKDLYHTLLKKLAHFQVEHPYFSIVILILLTVAIYGGVSQVRTVASLEQMMPDSIEEIKAFNILRDNYLGQDMIAVVLEIDPNSHLTDGVIDVRDREVHDYVERVKNSLKEEVDIIDAYAYSDIISMVATEMLPEGMTSDSLSDEEYQALFSNPEVKKYLSDYINDDYTVSIILATTDVSADDPRMNLLSTKVKEKVDQLGHPAGLTISFTGTPIIQQKLGELIAKDRNDTKNISTFLVFLITLLVFGTFTSALVPIIVVTISVNWLYGTMGYVGLPISTLAGGVAAMVIGIGIDFAIHIMNKFKYERKAGMKMKAAVEAAVVETGTALTATSLTTISAFLAFLVGQMPEMGRFGILMAIGITYSLIFSLFGLPALLVLEEKLVYTIRGKMKFGVEGEFHLDTDDETKRKLRNQHVKKKGKIIDENGNSKRMRGAK